MARRPAPRATPLLTNGSLPAPVPPIQQKLYSNSESKTAIFTRLHSFLLRLRDTRPGPRFLPFMPIFLFIGVEQLYSGGSRINLG